MSVYLRNFFTILITVFGLSACVACQSIDLKYAADSTQKVGNGTPIAVQVKDERPYVQNKNKTPDYIGSYRAGFGNKWDVSTKHDLPLAQIMEKDLTQELTDSGFAVKSFDAAVKKVQVLIKDWNFDTYINGRFTYAIDVNAIGDSGSPISHKTLHDEVVIEGNLMTGAKSAFEEEIPKIYNKILRQIISDDSALVSALQAQK